MFLTKIINKSLLKKAKIFFKVKYKQTIPKEKQTQNKLNRNEINIIMNIKHLQP